jgi:SagB-type dehydrogenase family enzyme
LRTAPSAGGRYPLETYVLALRVDGIPPGIYRYLPDSHQLVAIRAEPDLRPRVIEACYRQSFAGEAAAVIVWAAIPARTEWKYGYLAHRMIAMEAGHAGQNLYLACEAVGSGACALLSYDQGRMDALLGLDGEDEFAIYLAAVGKVGE